MKELNKSMLPPVTGTELTTKEMITSPRKTDARVKYTEKRYAPQLTELYDGERSAFREIFTPGRLRSEPDRFLQ